MKVKNLNDFVTDVKTESYEDLQNNVQDKNVAKYRELAHIEEDAEITEDNLDDWALKHTCVLRGCSYESLKNKLLGK